MHNLQYFKGVQHSNKAASSHAINFNRQFKVRRNAMAELKMSTERPSHADRTEMAREKVIGISIVLLAHLAYRVFTDKHYKVNDDSPHHLYVGVYMIIATMR